MDFDSILAQFLSLDNTLDGDVAIRILKSNDCDLNRSLEFLSELKSSPEDYETYVKDTLLINMKNNDKDLSLMTRPDQVTVYMDDDKLGNKKKFSLISLFHRGLLSRVSDYVTSLFSNQEEYFDSFNSYFESHFSNEHPTFFVGTFTQALMKSFQEDKFLLLYIHSPQHPDSSLFCSDVLTNPDFIQLVSNLLIMYATNIQTSEGLDLSYKLGVSTYPFLAILGTESSVFETTSNDLESNNEYIKYTVHKYLSVEGQDTLNTENLITMIEFCINKHEKERHEKVLRQIQEAEAERLRREADAEYEEALAHDRINELNKQKQEKEKEEREKYLQSLQNQQLEAKKYFENNPEYNEKDKISVAIRLLNGKRIKRFFSPNDQFNLIYSFAFANSDKTDDFELVAPQPRVVYKKSDKSLQELNIKKQLLLVQEINEEI